jgi:hypothetical protein
MNNKIIIIISSYIAHFTNVPMRFTTTSGGLFRAAYAQWQQLTIMRDNKYVFVMPPIGIGC